MSDTVRLTADADGERIDVFLSRRFREYSRGYFQRLIKSGKLTVNDRQVVAHYQVKAGDAVVFTPPPVEVSSVVPERMPLDIIHEDRDILVVNKPVGLVVHPACGHRAGTLLNALAGYAEGKFQPLLVHRLDKDTSGVMIVAKNERSKNSLVKQFQHRKVRKVYLVAVAGELSELHGRIKAPLGRSELDRKKIAVGPLAKKMAITEFSVVARSRQYSLLEAHPITGRTHQIRSHFAYIGHPVLGDATYGGPERVGTWTFSRQMLHAYRISFTHPDTGKPVEFIAPPPEDISRIWRKNT